MANKLPTIRDIRKRAAELGITHIETTNEDVWGNKATYIYAPDRYQFKATGGHVIVCDGWFMAAMEDMSQGLQPCDGGSNCDSNGCELG